MTNPNACASVLYCSDAIKRSSRAPPLVYHNVAMQKPQPHRTLSSYRFLFTIAIRRAPLKRRQAPPLPMEFLLLLFPCLLLVSLPYPLVPRRKPFFSCRILLFLARVCNHTRIHGEALGSAFPRCGKGAVVSAGGKFWGIGQYWGRIPIRATNGGMAKQQYLVTHLHIDFEPVCSTALGLDLLGRRRGALGFVRVRGSALNPA